MSKEFSQNIHILAYLLLKIKDQHEDLSEEESTCFTPLKLFINECEFDKDDFLKYLKGQNLITAPEYIEFNGRKNYILLSQNDMFQRIRLTTKGDNVLKNEYLNVARNWIKLKKDDIQRLSLQLEILKKQCEYIDETHKISIETNKTAKSATHAAWATAIASFFSIIISIMALIKSFL